MTAMEIHDFEQRYRRDGDPWGYRSSRYERDKYTATLAACGPGPFGNALELGASIGVFSMQLAPRCRSLTTIDFAPTAVRIAETELAGHSHVRVLQGQIPDDLPDGLFDLVVASEILYYLDRAALRRTASALERQLVSGGRLVCVHWRRNGPDRPLTADEVHRTVRALPWLESLPGAPAGEYLLDVFERP